MPFVGIGTPPQPPTRRLVCHLPPVSGGRGTLAGEKRVGRVPIPTRGIHCDTLYMYVLCGLIPLLKLAAQEGEQDQCSSLGFPLVRTSSGCRRLCDCLCLVATFKNIKMNLFILQLSAAYRKPDYFTVLIKIPNYIPGVPSYTYSSYGIIIRP
jgi:hypothetical protein